VSDRIAEIAPALTRIAAIGAIVLATLLAALAVSGDDSYEVKAVFDDVRGLIEGGEVRAGSVNVGEVTDVTIGEDEMPVVTMRVDDDFPLRQGAFADLKVASNVGAINRYVDLRQGEGPELGEGATLGPSHTDQPVDLDLAVSTLQPETREDLAKVIAGLDRGTRGRGPDLGRTLQHSAKALGETANVLALAGSDQEALSTLVRETDRVFGALAQSPADLGAVADQLAAVLDVAAQRAVELRRSAAAFGPGISAARGAIERLADAIPNLSDLLDAARPAAAELVPTGRALRPAVAALRVVLDEAGRLIADAPGQLRALRPVINAAPSIIKRLGPISDGLNPFLDHLRVRIPEIVNFFVLAGDATSNYDANGNLIRSTAIAIQFPRHPNLIGPSDDSPGSVVRPFDRTPGSLEGEPWENYDDSFIGGGKRTEDFIDPEEMLP
jgi:phospholipid/cholesterol/gamma-HCH transport system substrate-binding protein